MQYHLNGYRTGDPAKAPAIDQSKENKNNVDVLIIGCGPAGLTLAAQLAIFPSINTRIVDKKSGPLSIGQADGIACRSMEMFEAFEFADKVKKEAYWVNEVAFWRPGIDGNAALIRADRIQDVEDDLSEMPHTILNQARVHDFYLERMRDSVRRMEPDYDMTLLSLVRNDANDYPVEATFDTKANTTETICAQYVVGCDGARSIVRQSLGLELKGEAARQLWGVMDVLALTDFPDIRLKAAIQSANNGSLLVIPREGGYMVRLYIEMDELHGNERASDCQMSADDLISKAQAILSPYTLDVKEVAWWSAYEIGQRVCDEFDDAATIANRNNAIEPRIFIAGDACHTHSPKAGQGMNVSMADTFNLGWKLAAVLKGQSGSQLLNTYSQERQSKAKELIDFDREMARLFSEKSSSESDAKRFQQYFKQHGRYTAGVETCYESSLITVASKYQMLATGFPTGKRFHSAPVIRLADAKPMQLGHVLKADGRWRIIGFAPKYPGPDTTNAISNFCEFLQHDTNSPIAQFTPTGADSDSVLDLRVVFQQSHRDIAFETLPDLLKPTKGRLGLIDYEKAYCANLSPGQDIFALRGIDRENGAVIIVRPDQYVSDVLPLSGYDLLVEFFTGFLIRQ